MRSKNGKNNNNNNNNKTLTLKITIKSPKSTLSRVMATSSCSTSNITRQSSIYSLKSLGSINIDNLFPAIESDGGGGDTSSATISRQGSVGTASKVEEVWTEIDGVGVGVGGEITLEDFLAREDGFMSGRATVFHLIRKRGSKRDGMMDPIDKAALQRQKRMIKNRESAARSRERKQAYTAELECLVTKLEEENAQLVRHQEECNRKRLRQLAECLIPITEQRKPLRTLRRTRSMECLYYFER